MIITQQGTVTATANDQSGNQLTCLFSRVSGQAAVTNSLNTSAGLTGQELISVPASGVYGSLQIGSALLGWKFLLNQDGSIQWTIDVNGAVQEGNF